MNEVEVSSCCFYFILKFGLLFFILNCFSILKSKSKYIKKNHILAYAYLVDGDME
jgi:hypothetical protein